MCKQPPADELERLIPFRCKQTKVHTHTHTHAHTHTPNRTAILSDATKLATRARQSDRPRHGVFTARPRFSRAFCVLRFVQVFSFSFSPSARDEPTRILVAQADNALSVHSIDVDNKEIPYLEVCELRERERETHTHIHTLVY